MPPLKAQLLLAESLAAYFPEMVFTDSGITVQLHRNTHKQAEQILRGEQPAKGLQYAKRAKKLASERKATIDLDNEHLSEIEKYR